MEGPNSSKLKPLVRLYWFALLIPGIAPLGYAIYKGIDFNVTQILSLALIFAISVVINKYEFSPFKNRVKISGRELMIFWGIIWLGIPGGILIAVSAALASLKRVSISKRDRWLFNLSVSLITTYVSASLFYFVLNVLSGYSETELGRNQLSAGAVFAATLGMACVHCWLGYVISSIYLKISSGASLLDIWKNNFSSAAAGCLCGGVAIFAIQTMFFKFGLNFLLIVLPIVVAGHLVYRFFVRKLAKMTREISESSRIHLATVEALATAIDARDQVGVGHVRRTQIYSVGIGELMGLSEDEIKALNAGALLHGIGKLAVPDNILNKPGRLTPAEKEKTKIHSIVGASIIENVQFPYPVSETVRHYNEMWIGNGYPDRLKGEEIPITARILAVADAYDTLRGERPYRPAVSRDQARRILQNGSGTQYDPQIVDIFLRNLSQLEALVEENGLSYAADSAKVVPNREEYEGNFVEQIKSANREVFTMYELARVFSSSLNLSETLEVFASKIKTQVPFDTCVVYLMNESNTFAKAVYTQGKNSVALENKCVEVGEGATGYVLQQCVPVCDINPALDFSFDQMDFIEQYSAMASLPLMADDKLLGAVSIYSCELNNYGEEHLRLIEMVSHIASDAISMALQHAESETRALTDPMTGLPNARSLQIQFEKEVARANRNGSSFQLLMLDLDGFKAVNDTFGHKAGDRMLNELAKVMKNQLRDYDFLARYAGDEFVIIVPETNSTGIDELCERLERSVANFKLPIDDGRFAAVGVSLGSSCYPNDGETIDQIIISADKKMYSIKAERKLKQTLPELKVREAAKNAKAPKQSEEADFILELDESHIVSSAVN